MGQRREGPAAHRRGRAGQPRVGALGATQERDHRGAVPRAVQARRPRRRPAARLHARQSGGAAGVHGAPLRAGAGAVRPLGSRTSSRHQALRAPGLHHGRRRAADAGLPALRARRRRLERPAAQRVTRDPAAVQRRAGHPVGRDQAGAGHARGPGREGHAQIRDVLEDVRPRVEGGPSRGSRQPRSPGQAAAILVHPPTGRRADRLAGRLRRPDEGRPDRHLLHHRRRPRRGPPQPASRDLRQARSRGPAVARTHRRVGGLVAPRVRRQAAAVGGGQRPRSQRHRRRGADAGRHHAVGRTCAAARAHADGSRRPGQRGPGDDAADRIAGVPRQQPGGSQHQPGTADEGGGPGDAGLEADPRGERRASARATAQRRDRPRQVQRLEPDPLRPGHARRRRADRGSGGVRQAAERADAGAGRGRTIAPLDAWRLSAFPGVSGTAGGDADRRHRHRHAAAVRCWRCGSATSTSRAG